MLPLTERVLRGEIEPDVAAPTLARWGGPEDAAVLLGACLGGGLPVRAVLPVVGATGDRAVGARVWAAVDAGDLPLGDAAIALGRLGVSEARDRLLDVALHGGDWSEQRDASLAAAWFEAGPRAAEIGAALDGDEGEALFREYLPALAFRLPPARWPERLAAWAARASVDCNGGLFVGVALFGAPERARFESMLDDPLLEAQGGGTGTDWAAWHGARRLGIGLAERFALVRDAAARGDPLAAHRLRVLLALLRVQGHQPPISLPDTPAPADRFAGLRALGRGSDDLVALTRALLPERTEEARALLWRFEALARWEAAVGG